MKKLSITLAALLLLVFVVFPAALHAQVEIQTRKLRISDFTVKTTKVVLAGSDIFNVSLQEEVSRRWMASPFEFCSAEEYERLREDPGYYFLVPRHLLKGKDENESGISILSLVKGGKGEDAIEVVSVPYSPSDASSGRELIYLPALLHIIQDFAVEAMSSDQVTVKGLRGFMKGMGKARHHRVVVSGDDIAPAARGNKLIKSGKVEVLDEDEADELFDSGAQKTIVSYMVAPAYPAKGSVCYCYLISADSHELYYFKRHVIKKESAAGFQAADLKAAAR